MNTRELRLLCTVVSIFINVTFLRASENINSVSQQEAEQQFLSQSQVGSFEAALTGDNNRLFSIIKSITDLNRPCNSEGETLLHKACYADSSYGVEQLLLHGADVCKQNAHGFNPLHAALERGKVVAVESLLNARAFQKGERAELHARTKKSEEMPLHIATRNELIGPVRLLLNQGVPIDVPNAEGLYPLHLASQKGNDTIIELLLKSTLAPSVRDKQGRTALHHASAKGSLASVEKLVACKAIKIDQVDTTDRQPIHSAASGGHRVLLEYLYNQAKKPGSVASNQTKLLFDATRSGKADCLEFLLDQGINKDLQDDDKNTALHIAVEKQSVQEVELLLKKGSARSVRNTKGMTPFHVACNVGGLDCVRVLLENEAHDDSQDNDGLTPFFHAVLNGHVDLLKTFFQEKIRTKTPAEQLFLNEKFQQVSQQNNPHLLDALITVGAQFTVTGQANWKDKEGNSLAHYAARNDSSLDTLKKLLDSGGIYKDIQGARGYTPLHTAIQCGSLAIVTALVESYKVDKNLRAENNHTVLHIAAANKRKDILEYLIGEKCKCSVFDTDSMGRTPLHSAAESGSEECLQVILDHVSHLRQNDDYCNKTDKDNNTALHVAASKGHKGCVALLLARGAKSECINKKGETPFVIALKNGNNECMKLLLPSPVSDPKYAQRLLMQWIIFGQEEGLAPLKEHDKSLPTADTFEADSLVSFAIADKKQNDKEYQPESTVKFLGDFRTGLNEMVIFLDQPTTDLLRDLPSSAIRKGWTALHWASFLDRGTLVRALLQAGASPLSVDICGESALHIASQYGHELPIESLLNGRHSVNDIRNKQGKAALHYAAQKGKTACLRRLLDAQANPDMLDNQNCSPLHWACEKNHKECAEELLKRGAVQDLRNKRGKTALDLVRSDRVSWETLFKSYPVRNEALSKQEGSGEPDKDITISLASSKTILVPEQTNISTTLASSRAASSSSVKLDLAKPSEQFKAAISQDAHLNLNERSTYLSMLVAEGKIDDLLKVLGQTHYGESINTPDVEGITPLSRAALKGNIQIASALFTSGALITGRDAYHMTPLHYAAQSFKKHMVEFLLENQAEVDAKNDQDYTPLHSVLLATAQIDVGDNPDETAQSFFDALACVRLLLQKGADVNAVSKKGYSPVHIASMQRYKELLEELIKTGKANVHLRAAAGETALSLAAEMNLISHVLLLMNNNAQDERIEQRSFWETKRQQTTDEALSRKNKKPAGNAQNDDDDGDA